MSAVTVTRPAVPQGRRSAIVALARIEGLRMLLHPAFLVGLAASIGQIALHREGEDWSGQAHHESTTAWVTAWIGVLVAAALSAGRQRLNSDPDLFPATPLTPGDRAVGTLLGLLGPALAASVAAVFLATLRVRAGGFAFGDPPHSQRADPSLFEWAQPVLLVVLAGVVGTICAQLRHGRLPALMVAGMAIYAGATAVWLFQAHPLRVLHPFMFPAYEQRLAASFDPRGSAAADLPLNPPGEHTSSWHAVRFDTAALGWHLVYVAGLILIGAWVANRIANREERGSSRGWLIVAGLPVVAIGGVAQIVTAGVNG